MRCQPVRCWIGKPLHFGYPHASAVIEGPNFIKTKRPLTLLSVRQLYALRRLMQGSMQTPKAPLGNNGRPLQALNHRTVRTNIDFQNAKVIKSFPLDLPATSWYGLRRHLLPSN